MATVTNYYTVTFTPSLDGYVGRGGVNQTFANIRAGAGNDSSYVTNTGDVQLSATSTTNQFADLYRNITLFDTSTIPAGATISSATLSIYGVNKGNGLGSPPGLLLVSSNPASTSALVNADYSTLGSTDFGSATYSSLIVGRYMNISLNASGMSNITKGGISKFGLVIEWDFVGTFSGTWASLQNTFMQWNNGNATTNKPILTVNYSVDFPTLSINNISSLANVTTITTS